MKKEHKLIAVIASICLLIALMAVIAIINWPKNDGDISPDVDENVKLLFFGKDTYKSSMQSESIKIDWTPHETAPIDTSLTQMFFNDNPYFTINTPSWEISQYGDTIVFHEEPVYIALTIKESKSLLWKKTIDNLSQFEILTRFSETKTEKLQIGNYKIQKSMGVCNAETSIIELRKYVSYTFGDGILQYCLVGVTTYESDTTVEVLGETIEDMIRSISFNGAEQ